MVAQMVESSTGSNSAGVENFNSFFFTTHSKRLVSLPKLLIGVYIL